MNTQLIFENAFYSACTLQGALIVENKKSGKGIRLVGENAPQWINSIKTASDSKEQHLLCKALAQYA